MITMSKKIFWAGLISLISLTASAEIAGTYQCKGYNPYTNEHKNFTEIMTFAKTANANIYSMQLANSDSAGIPYMLGTAIVNPEIKNAVSFIVWDTKKTDVFGVGHYEVKSDGSLDGVWSTQGTNKVGTETCTKNS